LRVSYELTAGEFELRDFGLERGELALRVTMRSDLLQPIVDARAIQHRRRTRTEVLAGLAPDALSLVAPVIDTILTPRLLQGVIDEGRPPLARRFDPGRTMKRPALACTAGLGRLARPNHCAGGRSMPSFRRSENIRCTCGLCSSPSIPMPS
jgi:hypothetical protein